MEFNQEFKKNYELLTLLNHQHLTRCLPQVGTQYILFE